MKPFWTVGEGRAAGPACALSVSREFGRVTPLDSHTPPGRDASPSAPSAPLETALAPLHAKWKARMVKFAGYHMPLQYPEGIKAEPLHTRARASLFDVSHMGQLHVYGDEAAGALETLVTGDIAGLAEFQQRYTLLTGATGGIIDDLMVTKIPGGLFLVVNAAGKDRVWRYIGEALPSGLRVERRPDRALLALQGPEAVRVLAGAERGAAHLPFMHAGPFTLHGLECFINRCGYTGEDGFEIAVDNAGAMALAEYLLDHPAVMPAGLAARDSLRLEAGLCLHGHDIDEQTTPVEANLAWAIAVKYRRGSEPARFPGAGTLLQQLKEGPARRLVGLRPVGRIPVREGTVLLDVEGRQAGQVTSGGFGPTVGGPVALGYVSIEHARPGTELQVEIRNRFHTMRVAELPFVSHRYHRP